MRYGLYKMVEKLDNLRNALSEYILPDYMKIEILKSYGEYMDTNIHLPFRVQDTAVPLDYATAVLGLKDSCTDEWLYNWDTEQTNVTWGMQLGHPEFVVLIYKPYIPRIGELKGLLQYLPPQPADKIYPGWKPD